MPATIAAAPASRAATFDFAKSAGSFGFDAGSSFASKLLDARQNLPAAREMTPTTNDAKRVDRVEKQEPARSVESAEDVEDDVAPEEATAADESRDKPKHQGDTPADAAALAAITAQPAQVMPTQQAEADVDTQPDARPAPQDVLAAVAATTADAVTDPAKAMDLAGHAAPPKEAQATVNPDAATKQRPAEKLDALTAQMTPTETAEAIAPPAAGSERHSSGEDAPTDQRDAEAALGKPADGNAPTTNKPDASAFDDMLSKLTPTESAQSNATPEAKPAAPTPTPVPVVRPEHQFARDNVDRVVSSVQSQVNAGGNGQMRVRLDPPELGALDVAVKMLEGRMTASFTTTNDQATQLLSHSLNQLKHSLESAGIAVDRIEVRQAAAPSSSSSGNNETNQQQSNGRGSETASQHQGEQQRRQMVDRLWRKYAYGSDEVDLVA